MAKESINQAVFAALKVSEKSGIPVMLMSNPGVGKSTTIEYFAEIRGYHLEPLRGNSTSHEEIHGYDVADTSPGAKSTIHLRPSWFNSVLEQKEKGVPTLLFLDEITTAPELVQGALLQIVFDRRCGVENLPTDTLIVAAGNYAQNLSNQMNLLAPLMNRFMIFNITATSDDLGTFLCKYAGALATGIRTDYKAKLRQQLVDLDSIETETDEIRHNKIGAYIEQGVQGVTAELMKTGKIDFSVTDLASIYSDTISDSKLYGYVTLRAVNYLRDVAIAMYECFGKDGITSTGFRNMIDGLCGIGVSRAGGSGSSGDVVINHIGADYHKYLSIVANDLEKLNCSKLPEYAKFFEDILTPAKKKGKRLEVPSIQASVNKLKEMARDKEVSSIDRPLDHDMIVNMYKTIMDSAKDVFKLEISMDANIRDFATEEEIISGIVYWNSLIEFSNEVTSLLVDKSKNYEQKTIDIAKDVITNSLGPAGFKVNAFRQLSLRDGGWPEIANTFPSLKELNKIK